MTKRENLSAIITILNEADRPELVAFCEKQIEALNASKNAIKKPTAEQQKNAALASDIKDWMSEVDRPVSIAEIMEHFGSRIKSGQHANALMIKERKAGEIRRVYNGKAVFFELGQEENS